MWFIDRWGAQWDDDIPLERFTELFDELAADDDEPCVVDITDEHGWNVEFSLTRVRFGDDEGAVEEGSLVPADRADVLAIAAQFLNGDFEALRQRPWA